MARATLGDIIEFGHLMADVPEPSTSRSSAFASEREIIRIANKGLAKLHEILVDKFEGWLQTKGIMNIEQGEESTLLPSDFFKLNYVFLLHGNERVELFPFELRDLSGTTTSETSEYPEYKLMSNHIYWYNPPNADRHVEIWYTRQFIPLINRDDEISPELPSGWEQYPIAYVAKYLLGKAERDPSIAIMELREVESDIISSASNRDASRPRTTVNIKGRWPYNRRRFPTPRVT